MSIGRIEMVDGVKKNVVYATLGGAGGIQVGNVQDLSIEENSDNLTLKWKDPENVVFNGETIAEWAGTKVVRKEGSSPESVTDGTLVVDSIVKDQYAIDGLQDSNVVTDTQYNYALFPYTVKNVYTLSDANRIVGKKKNTYDPILQNNSWMDISNASKEGVAAEWWNVGDIKDGYTIIGFDHDDLTDGTGKAGITFCLMDKTKILNAAYDSRSGYYNYAVAECQTVLDDLYNGLPNDLKQAIKQVNKKYQVTTTMNGQLGTIAQKLFLLSSWEAVGKPANASVQGPAYAYTGNYPNAIWTRTTNSTSDEFAVYNRIQTYYSKKILTIGYGYAFCI